MCLCSKIKGPHKQIKLTMIKKNASVRACKPRTHSNAEGASARPRSTVYARSIPCAAGLRWHKNLREWSEQTLMNTEADANGHIKVTTVK